MIICPHCKEFVIIEQINCGIFRHGVFKTGEQIHPHLSQEKWEELIKGDLIYGCGKPFRVKVIEGEMIVEECGFDT